METICAKIKIKNGTTSDIRNWFQNLKNRLAETLSSLENEGVLIESVFLDQNEDGSNYLIYYMKAKDLSYAKEVAKNSTLDIDKYHKECKSNFCELPKPLELLADFNLIEML